MVCVCIYIYIWYRYTPLLFFIISIFILSGTSFGIRTLDAGLHACSPRSFDRSVYCRSATTSDVGASALADLLAYLRIHLAREARTCLRSQAALKCRLSCRQIESNHTDHLRSFKDLLIMNSSESGI